MALGGSAVKKAPVQLYGIPQENMGTSSQMGFGKNGGTVKKPLVKAQMGKTVKTKPIPDDVYKRDSTNYANAANKYLNATSKKDFQVGADSLKAIKSRYGTPNALEKRMGRTTGGYGVDSVKKNGGSVNINKKTNVMKKVKKMQDGGMSMSSKKTNIFGKSKDIDNLKAIKKKIKWTVKPGSTETMSTNGTETTYVTKPKANSNRSVTSTFKKVGGAVKKSLVKAQMGKTVKTKTPFQAYMKTPGATPSDTTQTFSGSRDGSNPKLDKAYYDTYYAGQENKRRTGIDKVKYDAKGNRLGTGYKKAGGTVKTKKK